MRAPEQRQEAQGERARSTVSDRTARPFSRHSHGLVQQQTRVSEDGNSVAHSRPASIAPTTVSNVKKLVADSRFHDETLCQLLDAARLNLIGGEAKKALNRAARARIVELKDIKSQERSVEVPSLDNLKRHKRKGSKDKHGRRSESRRSEQEVDNSAPPPWVNDVSTPANLIGPGQHLTSRSCPVSRHLMLDFRSWKSRNTIKVSLNKLAKKCHRNRT